MIKLVLLDRDGVINEDRPDSVKSPEELILLPGAGEAISALNRANMKVVIVTNQSCVGRHIITLGELSSIHARLHRELALQGARIDDILYCTDPVPSPRRKPAPGMLLEAFERFQIHPHESVLIGDDLRDLEAAQAAGCYKILVRTGKGAQNEKMGLPEYIDGTAVFDSLKHAVEALLETSS